MNAEINGAVDRIRTYDPRITNAVLYQLSYNSIYLMVRDVRIELTTPAMSKQCSTNELVALIRQNQYRRFI